jgi:putative nucleotidyltransferase with HDIG domain
MKFLYKKNWTETTNIKEKLAFIEKIEEFPSLPSVVLPLLSRLNDPNVSIKEIEKLIYMDPGMVSYILKLTNSLMFGLLEKVYSIARSIILIGMSNLRSLVTSYSIRVMCNSISDSQMQEYLWNHSLATAVFSKVISEKVYKRRNDNAYVFGLLHDIGKIVLYIHNSNDLQESMMRGVEKNLDFVSAEKQIFGFSHIEAGYLMIDKLGFTKQMKDVVLYHHNPDYGPSEDRMHWIVGMANELAHNVYDNKLVSMDIYLQHFSFSDEEVAELIEKSKTELEQYRALL